VILAVVLLDNSGNSQSIKSSFVDGCRGIYCVNLSTTELQFKAVLDTNIYIAAFANPKGRNAAVWNAAVDGRYEPVVSPAIIREMAKVLRRDFAWRKDRVQVVIRVVAQAARIIVPRSVLSVVTADPDDNRILECTVDGKAQALGLAGVDHPSTGVLVQVHAGRQRQLGGFVAQIHRGGRL
jgi:putative PIN family toxin of toxin-antitoxin system